MVNDLYHTAKAINKKVDIYREKLVSVKLYMSYFIISLTCRNLNIRNCCIIHKIVYRIFH